MRGLSVSLALLLCIQLAWACSSSDSKEVTKEKAQAIKSEKKRTKKPKKATRKPGGRRKAPPETVDDKSPPNIVVFLIDTLRRDHLSCYGYDKPTTPEIDALAAKGTLFENAVSQASWTAPSVAGLFTSRFPSQIGVGSKVDLKNPRRGASTAGLGDDEVTIAEVLRDNRYQTAAVATNPYVSNRFGLLQGFTSVTSKRKGRADWVTAEAMKWTLKKRRRSVPFFLYLHFMDVHDAAAPSAFRRIYLEDSMKQPGFKPPRIDNDLPKWIDYRKIQYDAAITYVDNYIGDFVEFMKREQLYDNTVFLVVSDHGEELADHTKIPQKVSGHPNQIPGFGHGHSMFAELTNVPLVIHGRKIPVKRVPQLVGNIDIAPTIAALCGVETDQFLKEGRDLLDAKTDLERADVTMFSEDIAYGPEIKSLQNEKYKLIKGSDYELLFDKQSDPREKTDLSKNGIKEQKSLAGKLQQIIARTANKKSGTLVVIDDETREQLKELGYVLE